MHRFLQLFKAPHFLAIIILLLFSSCYAYKIYPKEARKFTYGGSRKEAFVVNPKLSKEYTILKRSGIFKIVEDGNDTTVIWIKLYPVARTFVCSEPILASAVTLGQWPVTLPDQYQFEFDEIHRGVIVHKRFDLKVATRYWFWDMFTFDKNFKKKAGQTLLAGYYNPLQNSPRVDINP